MTFRRLAVLLLALGVLAGCGEERAGSGQATLWITRDRGAEVIKTTATPAGITAMDALRREAEVETRHGGRFVQAIDGVEGDIGKQKDWFFFVNGYEADRGAADYRLHNGDVLWWDYRSWQGEMRVPLVVGSFPEPFLHGWGGQRRPAVVVGPPGKTSSRLAKLVGGSLNEPVPPGANVLRLIGETGFRAKLTGSPGDPVVFELGVQDAGRLSHDPALARYRYEGLP